MADTVINEIVGDFRFRSVTPADKDLFMSVRSEASDIAGFYRAYPDFSEYRWKQILEDEKDLSMVVFSLPDNRFVGTCSFQGLQKDTLELGYDVVKEYRGKGIGTKMVRSLVALAHSVFPEREVFIRVRKDNTASCRVAEKCGGVFLGMADVPEIEILQKSLEENGPVPISAETRALIERARNTVRVYKV